MKLLHLHSGFDAGGKELRSVRLMNAFGTGAAHTVVSGTPGAYGAARALDARLKVSYPQDFPALTGKPWPRRLERIARAMLGHDLVLTYNWGAMDAVLAHTVFARTLGLPPLVHHEDGFNEDEAAGLKPTRNFYRRLALARADALVVPSRRLEEIALRTWLQPRERVTRIANGIDVRAYRFKPKPNALPRVVKRKGELWLGTLAGLRAVKNLPRLVRAFAGLPEEWQLVILGEGPEAEAIRAQALSSGVAHRVHLPGFAADPAKVMGLFDLFALSSDSEQFPISVVEAMAAGLAVASTDVGDVAAMVSGENRRFVVPGEAALAGALAALAGDPALRRAVGEANRVKAAAQYDEKRMIASYAALYGGMIGRAFPRA